MGQKGLTSFFEEFLDKEPLFQNKRALQSQFMPESISHRDVQIKQVANILAPALRLEKPSNLFVYGKTGSGKTLTVKYTIDKMNEVINKKKIPLNIMYLNCKLKKVADTEYRLIAQLARNFGKSIPSTGLPTEEVYKIFFSALDNEKKLVILVLDEIDQLVRKTGDEILYNLTRMNEELKETQISLMGISNDLTFIDGLDPRVKSSLSEEELIFPPYNALQIQEILRQRSKTAFKEGSLENGLIEKCAAYSAREHGDARRALELLRVAGEVAEREGETVVKIGHLDKAENKIEKDKVMDMVATQPKQFQAVLYAIVLVNEKGKNSIFTGEVYDVYRDVCSKTALRPLTQRRISDVIAEFDMFGIINIKVISKGRYGRTREISLSTPSSVIPKIKKLLEDDLSLN
ncbi:MAG: ORC1-type DNA replication protein [Candidatus Woesearchaeota archaeon]|jgi:cell division control protein 6|nr:ORC1-type DNA replication protein [Candidatus Woesearchaeota archaeon]